MEHLDMVKIGLSWVEDYQSLSHQCTAVQQVPSFVVGVVSYLCLHDLMNPDTKFPLPVQDVIWPRRTFLSNAITFKFINADRAAIM